MKTQMFRVSVKDLFGDTSKAIDPNVFIGVTVYHNVKPVGTITGYDKDLDSLTGIITDETLFDKKSFSMEMVGSNRVDVVKLKGE